MIEENYDPEDWFWIVGGDTSRYWSSAAVAYVEAAPDGRISRTPSEEDLSQTLRHHGLVGPIVTIDDVKAEAQRRIYAAFPQWKQANLTARGVELQDAWREHGTWTEQEAADAQACRDAWDWIKSVRDASDVIEQISPIPRDYRDDKYWPA